MSKRILIVDDEPDIVRALTLRLRTAGYTVLSAVDGMQATRLVIKERPDCVVLDLGLPGGDGHTVAARLRTNSQTASIPVIVLTARTAADERTRCIDNGVTAFLTKPYRADVLLSAVQRAVA